VVVLAGEALVQVQTLLLLHAPVKHNNKYSLKDLLKWKHYPHFMRTYRISTSKIIIYFSIQVKVSGSWYKIPTLKVLLSRWSRYILPGAGAAIFVAVPSVEICIQCSGLWIWIDLIRIRIQAKTELSKTISFSNFFEIKILVKSNQKYRYLCNLSQFFQVVVRDIIFVKNN
jgi:hypothetical protein